jgi:uncharacterized protein
MEPKIADNPDEDRYEITVDGEVAGFAQYGVRPGLIAFVHTEIADGHEGQGLGSKLIRFSLDDARARGLRVLPFCPFVNGYIHRHPEDAELVPAEYRGQFDI